MPDKITNELLFEQLEAIQAHLGNVENGQAEIRTTLVGIQQHMTGFMTNATAHEGAIVTIQGRLDRIERRLGLTGASAE